MSEEKKLNKSLVIIAAVLITLVLIATGIIITTVLLQNKKTDEQHQEQILKKNVAQFKQKDPALAEDMTPSETLKEVGYMYKLDPFTVNLLSNDENRYLLVTISLEFNAKELSEKLKKELEVKTPVIRDTIIRILSSKTVDDISSDRAKMNIAKEIADNINSILENGVVKNIYYTQFIMQ